jgi:hypothetical protein
VYRPAGHEYADWRIPTQEPPRNAFIPDDRGDAWHPGVGGGGSGYAGRPPDDLNDENNEEDMARPASDFDDEYNGEDKTQGGLGHLDTHKGKWTSDYHVGSYARASAPLGVDQPLRNRLTSYDRPFDPPSDSDDLSAWTRRSDRGSNPDPNPQGAYYNKGPGPVPGNRHPAQSRAWLQAPLQQLHDALRRSHTDSEQIAGEGRVGTQWIASARAATVAAKFAAKSAARAVPVLTEPGYSTGLFGGITGSASSNTASSLWGDSYDSSQS